MDGSILWRVDKGSWMFVTFQGWIRVDKGSRLIVARGGWLRECGW